MKKILVGFLLTTLSFGAAEETLSLVIGSTRASGQIVGPLFKAVLDTEHADTTHTKTFGGKAITVDLNKSVLLGHPHLQVDAYTHKFPPIEAVYIERPETSNGKTPYENTVGNMLKNIARSMIDGATLEIEWDPDTSVAFPFVNNPLFDDSYLNEFFENNPFNGFSDINIMLNSFSVATYGPQSISNLPQPFQDIVIERSKKVSALIDFFVEQGKEAGVTGEQIKERLGFERRVINELFTHRKFGVALYAHPCSDFGVLEATPFTLISMASFKEQTEKGERIIISSKLHPEPGVVYDRNEFMQFSSFNYILSNLAVERQWPYVKDYLETIGFPGATLERKTSPHNGRKNVWIITAHFQKGMPGID